MDRQSMKDQNDEATEFLTPSHSKHGSAMFKSSKSEDIASARSVLLAGPSLTMIGLLLGATFMGLVHHFFLVFLRGRVVQQQFWMKNTSNALSTLVQSLCAASLSVSLTQLIWWYLRRRPFTVNELNYLFSLPGPFSALRLTITKRPWSILPILLMALIVQAYALVSILAPNALEVGAAPPRMQTITVPTIYFGRNPEIHGWAFPGIPSPCSYTITSTFSRILGSSLRSDTLIRWNTPPGCENGCNYTIEYGAPALRCSDIDPEDIIHSGHLISEHNISSAVLMRNDSMQGQAVYNATADGSNITVAWQSYNVEGDSDVKGLSCSLFNTTQQSVVSFLNNTGVITPRIVSYDGPYEDFLKLIGPMSAHDHECDGRQGTEKSPPMSYYLSYFTIVDWLFKQLEGSIMCMQAPSMYWLSEMMTYWQTESEVMSTSLFVLNETAATFSPRSEDIKTALEQILVNSTVALISSSPETTMVNASVVQNQLVWVYDARRLWVTYVIALTSALFCGAIGLACMMKNGEIRDLSFSDIAEATRNAELDNVFREGSDDEVKKLSVLQYGIQSCDGQKDSRVFGLVGSHEKCSSVIDME